MDMDILDMDMDMDMGMDMDILDMDMDMDMDMDILTRFCLFLAVTGKKRPLQLLGLGPVVSGIGLGCNLVV
jgi:hypothetical protein